MANQLLLVNPRKRRKARRKTAKKRVAPVRAKRRVKSTRKRITKRRRNPIARKRMSAGNIINGQVIPAFTAGVGALGLDMVMGYVPLPASMTTGALKHVVKGVGAIALGLVAGMVVKPSTAKELSMGALTVTMHDALREATQRFAPNIQLGYYNAGFPMAGMDEYNTSAMGFYGGDGSSIPTVGANINAPGLSPPCPTMPTSMNGLGMYETMDIDEYG